MKLIHVTKNNSKVYRLKDNRIGIITDLTKNFVIIWLGEKINNSQQGMTPIFDI